MSCFIAVKDDDISVTGVRLSSGMLVKETVFLPNEEYYPTSGVTSWEEHETNVYTYQSLYVQRIHPVVNESFYIYVDDQSVLQSQYLVLLTLVGAGTSGSSA
jgi:hypothetical protein